MGLKRNLLKGVVQWNSGGSWVSEGEDDYHPDREYLAKIKQFELGNISLS
ncbi:MAG: hypothetical protein EBE86_023400 [Hormoscilla sp. GUM202]|nr:hypothetical protein [Hormoscilla sp. GUM202]